jgi:xanthine dehydrogenase accessory factor
MRELAAAIADWNADGTRAVVARAVSVSGFGGRRAGEAVAVAVDDENKVAGRLLGGAADAEVRAAAGKLTGDLPTIELEVPIGDSDAVTSGLACGGVARLLVQDVASLPASMWGHMHERRPLALATLLPSTFDGPVATRSLAVLVDRELVVVDGDEHLVSPELRTAAVDGGSDLLRSGADASRLVDVDGGKLFLEAFVPPSRIVVVAEPSELAGAISAQASLLGWESIVGDDRNDSLTAIGALGPRDAMVVLSHDRELDVPALARGLEGRAYVGALGSRHTQQARRELLTTQGVDAQDMERIHGPIGLDIGSRTPEETAVSIFAEILAWRSGRDGRQLREGHGPING